MSRSSSRFARDRQSLGLGELGDLVPVDLEHERLAGGKCR